MDGWNGELAGYELRYQRVSGAGGGGGGQGHNTSGQRIPAERGQTVLEGLEKWSWYNLTLAAFTVEGSGPGSPGVLCRTDEDGETETPNDPLITFTERRPTPIPCLPSSRRRPPPGGRPAAQLLGAPGHLAPSVATVTARPDPRLPSPLRAGGERRVAQPPPHQRPAAGRVAGDVTLEAITRRPFISAIKSPPCPSFLSSDSLIRPGCLRGAPQPREKMEEDDSTQYVSAAHLSPPH